VPVWLQVNVLEVMTGQQVAWVKYDKVVEVCDALVVIG
jgi:hypothetical protein